MPNVYYNTQISDNMGETPEGFLLCKNVKIARTGLQEYTPREIGLNDNDLKEHDLRLNAKGHLYLSRPDEEVFSPIAIASFEGKPVTDEHPDGELRPENCMEYAKGTVTNVRRGEGDDKEYLIADLLITDLGLINKVKTGKRDVSCGYRCRFRYDDHMVTQTEIVGNHVAVTYSGRAGSEVAIKDSINSADGAEANFNERSKSKKMSKKNTNIFTKMFSSFIKDAEPEEVLEAADAVNKVNDEDGGEQVKDAAPAKDTMPPLKEEMPEEVRDAFQPGGKLDSIVEMLRGMEERLATLEKQAATAPSQPPVKDSLDELRDEIAAPKKMQDGEASEEAVTIDPESMESKSDEMVKDAGDDMIVEDQPDVSGETEMADSDVVKFIDGIKPKIASLKDDNEKKMMSDALSELIRSNIVKKNRPAAVKDSGKECDKAVVKDSAYFDIANRTIKDSRANVMSFGEACRKNHPSYKKQQ